MLIKKEEFCKWIEHFKTSTNESYIDSVLEACKYFQVDEEMVPVLLNVQILSKITAEAENLNYIKKTYISLDKHL